MVSGGHGADSASTALLFLHHAGQMRQDAQSSRATGSRQMTAFALRLQARARSTSRGVRTRPGDMNGCDMP